VSTRTRNVLLAAAGLTGAAVLWSCSFFHAELPGTACEKPEDCLSTETCELGQCVIPSDAAPVIDARPVPDAPPVPDGTPPPDAHETPDPLEPPDPDPPDAS